ncbi:MAG: hypothetical protein AABZ06_14475 [Bdellovibrionota bacterium]
MKNITNLIFGAVSMSMMFCGLMASDAKALVYEDGTVIGKVTFEKRTTIVPLSICEQGQICPKPQIYWSVMVHSNGVRYEIDEVFGLGNFKAPEYVELTGVVIKPGCQVALVGRVEPITKDYVIVSDIKQAMVLNEGCEVK